MSLWSKLGKIGLMAAPYVAAPFTGGASLAFTGAANKAVGAWNAKDARNNAAKGLAPSSFDRYLGLAGDVAGMASGAGALGKFGNAKYDTGGSQTGGGGWQDKLGGILGGSNDPNRYRTPPFVGNSLDSAGNFPWDTPSSQSGSGKSGISGFLSKLGGAKGIAGIAGGVAGGLALKKYLNNRNDNQDGEDTQVNQRQDYSPNPEPRDMGTSRFQRNMRRQLGPVMGQANQNNPNLALSIGQGKMDAMRDQPFRGGYDVRTPMDYDEETGIQNYNYTPMPRIGPDYRQRRQDQYYGGGGNPDNQGQEEMNGFKRNLQGRGRRYQQEEAAY